MIIEILVNSCARVDLLEQSISTFRKHIKTDKHRFRWIIVEDMVDDPKRQEMGKEWIRKNRNLFYKVVYLTKKAGPGYWWARTIDHCLTDYHIHLEDDCKFINDMNIDPVIEAMENNKNIVEVVFRRDPSKRRKNNDCEINGLKLTEMNLLSVASGIFNTRNVIEIIKKIGWREQLHEVGNLTPISKEMGLRKFILDHGVTHYVHVGQKKCYRKGKWKEK
jgi:hypothetical protein